MNEQSKKMKILLIDDEDEFRELTVKRLKRRGYDVRAAAGCPEAMELLAVALPDVIILDLNMPQIDGLQCLRNIKENLPQTPIIMLTGHACVDTGVEGISLGAFDYCLKPVELDELLEKVQLAVRAS